MAQHSTIEETFRQIAPSRRRGIPNPAPIAAGFDASETGLNTALSQAAQEIGQLRAAWQQQSARIASATAAIQSGGGSASVGGGGLGLLSPLLAGLFHLFSGGSGNSAPAELPVYLPPPPVAISGVVRSTAATEAPAPSQITVNISAMDSQSFLDRSNDIANAVRLAMLNLHPINDVVADL
jgi:hypothetical protein